MNNATVWGNLGWTYLKIGKTQEAYEALSSAIVNAPDSGIAFNNMATYYFKTGESQKAIEHALKAVELAPDMYQPMSTLAICYKMLGDEENFEKYCKLYGEKGGNEKVLRAKMG